MKTRTFLSQLKKKLVNLDEIEKEEIIKEYKGYIEELINDGVKEEDAVSSFGNIDVLANELLKTRNKNKKMNKDIISNFSKKVLDNVDIFIDYLITRNPQELIKVIIEIIFVIFALLLLHIPINILSELGKSVFNILSSPLNQVFYGIWQFVLEFSYIISFVVIILNIIKKRYIENYQKNKPTKKMQNIETKKNLKKKIESKKNKNIVEESFVKIFVIFFKLIAICILFGISIYLIGIGLVLAFCMYLLIKGVTYFGFYLVMVSLFILGMFFFQLLFNFVLDHSSNKMHYISYIIISFSFLVIGILLATFEISNTTFINEAPSDLQMEILNEELPFSNELIFVGNIANYEVDNNLDNIEVLFKYYPIGKKMSTDIRKNGNEVYLNWHYSEIKVSKQLIVHMIDDLKNKTIYNYYLEPQIIIKANEKNIERLKNNRLNYYQKKDNYSTCEFVRTYTVEMIKDSYKEDEKIVILSEYSSDDVESVRLNNNIANHLQIKNTYEFTFKTYQTYIDTDISDVFKENEVIGVHQTDKIGLEQRNDKICSIFY